MHTMTDPGKRKPSKGQSCKQKQIDYMAIAYQHAAAAQEPDPLSQICCHESLDSYAHLQSLISSVIYSFSISI